MTRPLPVQRGWMPSGQLARGRAGGKPEQWDERLGVLALLQPAVDVVERPRDDLDPFVLVCLGRRVGVAQPGRLKQPDALVAEAGARVEGRELAPRLSGLSDLLGQR